MDVYKVQFDICEQDLVLRFVWFSHPPNLGRDIRKGKVASYPLWWRPKNYLGGDLIRRKKDEN